jgi:hypothetical protein
MPGLRRAPADDPRDVRAVTVDIGPGAGIVRAAEEGAGIDVMREAAVRAAAGVADADAHRGAARALRGVRAQDLVPPGDVLLLWQRRTVHHHRSSTPARDHPPGVGVGEDEHRRRQPVGAVLEGDPAVGIGLAGERRAVRAAPLEEEVDRRVGERRTGGARLDLERPPGAGRRRGEEARPLELAELPRQERREQARRPAQELRLDHHVGAHSRQRICAIAATPSASASKTTVRRASSSAGRLS